MSDLWFPRIIDKEVAKKTSKQGAYAVILFSIMLQLGSAFMYFVMLENVDKSTYAYKNAINQIVGLIIFFPIMLLVAWRIYKGKGWFLSILIILYFIAEFILKTLGGPTSIAWFFYYAFIIIMAVNGFRGCWYLRNYDNKHETKIA